MWVLRNARTSGVGLRRILPYSITLCLVMLFAVFFTTTNAFADDAVWEGTELKYQGKTFTREPTNPVSAQDSRNMAGRFVYTNIEGGKAHSIFIGTNQESQIATQDSATYATYDYTPPNTYTNEQGRAIIKVTRSVLANDSNPKQNGSQCSGSVTMGLGWMLCPVSNFIASATDALFEFLRSFLEFSPLTGTDNSIYQLWSVMRTFANILFVVAFIAIIYSQITSVGISAYGIQKMLPKLIIAAIFVNISYWICSIAVDIANILGNSVQQVFMGIRENIVIKNATNLTWGSLTTWALSGGTIAITGVALAASTAGNAVATMLTLLLGLISAITAALVALAVLAIRQGLIAMLIMVSPLAFVAYILPNTEGLFKKWRDSLTTLLIFFPLFSLIFGASQVAGEALINRGVETKAIQIIILGFVVKVIVFIITPLIMQLSSGILARFAGIVNDKSKGPIDSMKNAIRDERDYQKQKTLGDPNRAINPIKVGARMANRRKIRRGIKQKAYEQGAINNALGTEKGEKADELSRTIDQEKRKIEGAHEVHWKSKFDIDKTSFDSAVFNKELAIKHQLNTAGLSEKRFETVQAEMKAGHDPFHALGMQHIPTKEFDDLRKDYQSTAEATALTGMRTTMADREEKAHLAKELKRSEGLRRYASGVAGDKGMNAVYAEASKDVSKITMDDINHIASSFDYTFAMDSKQTYDRFTGSTDMNERIALIHAFTKQGSAGDKNIRKAAYYMDEQYALGRLSNDDYFAFKELLSTVPNVQKQGEDIKRYLGNMSLGGEGAPPSTLKALGGDVKKVWLKASAESFSLSPPLAQIRTLRLLAQEKDGGHAYQTFIDNIPSEMRGNMKTDVRKLIELNHQEFLVATNSNKDQSIFG